NYDLIIDPEGKVWGWGDNDHGELGDGSTDAQYIPVQSLVNSVPLKPRIESLGSKDLGGFFYNREIKVILNFSVRMDPSSLTSENITLSDEKGNSIPFYLTINDGKAVYLTPSQKLIPQMYTLKVSNLRDAYGNVMSNTQTETFAVKLPLPAWPSPLSAGAFHSLDISGGEVSAWGENRLGQLGDGTTTDSSTPIKVPGLSGIVGVSGGDQFSLALKEDGTGWAWGRNNLGQLGDGTTIDRTKPIQIPGLTQIVYLSAGGDHSLAVKADGTVWSWGDNEYGQLGISKNSDYEVRPTLIEGFKDVHSVSAGWKHSLALQSDGIAWAWGNNRFGQLGDGTQKSKDYPVRIQGLGEVSQLDAGYEFSLAMLKNGPVWAWGNNTLSQLGINSPDEFKATPEKIPSLNKVTAIAAGGAHALVQSNQLWGWGFNFSGQVGNGTAEHTINPIEVLRNQYFGSRSYYRLAGNNRIETAIDLLY
ncbi:MAG: hypothetical protein M0T74_18360, partial [Desulfitobacterium hafniense]|nr:hypothetical protein [Desulfitobacterium hafniense]